MLSTSPDSNAASGDDAAAAAPVAGEPACWPTIYFDGKTNHPYAVDLRFGACLELAEDGVALASWPYDDLRMADGGAGTLRLKCVSSLPLARLDVSDPAVQAEIVARARFLEIERGGRAQTGRIVAWSFAAAVSIVLIVLYGLPLIAQRLTPLIPLSFERRLGAMVDNQVKAIFGGRACIDAQGSAALAKLVETLRQASHLDMTLQPEVLASSVPNAFALPGGKIYVLDGLLRKAESADELAGVIAHEMGHVSHRDQMRMMIQNGGMSFLVGLLFGDVTGSSAMVFVARNLLEVSYSRGAERNADAFAIETMHALGRSPAPMGELLFRITGPQGSRVIGLLASHPLTEGRRALMRSEDRVPTGPEILSSAEWQALKAICHSATAK
jgi:Zn-dependent protease with chaperone function